MASLNILFLTAYLPVQGIHGGGMRMFHNLKILSQKHQVTLLSFIESESEREYLLQLEELGIEVKTVLRRPSAANHLFLPKPREHDEYHSSQMAGLVQETLANRQFDVVQAEFLQMGQHVPRYLPIFKILTEHEVQYANFHASLKAEIQLFGKIKKFYDWLVQLNYEVKVCQGFDRVVCMTDEDLKLLSEFVPSAKLRKIPIGVDSDYFQPRKSLPESPSPARLLFVGNYRHTPNREAVHYFASKILPLIHGVIPEVEFWVVGVNSDMLDRHALSQTGKVKVIGHVKDIRTSYQEAALFVAPIQTGNGMRVKLLEAFSMAMAVVASPLATYGFDVKNEDHVLHALTAESFAAQTIRLLRDPSLRLKLGSNARKMIQQHYDWKVIEPEFLELVESRHV
jgi:glycosyltransferase involved in cell wall biosynthesis